MVFLKDNNVMQNDNEKIQHKLGICSLVGALMVTACVTCDIGKSVSNYATNYFNGGKYPLPQTLLVVILEILKLITTLLRMRFRIPSMNKENIKNSLKFVCPSAVYAINNNIFLAGLTLVTPPIWTILCSVRIVITAVIYKFILKRDITVLQFIGAVLILVSIIFAKLGDILFSDVANFIPPLAICYALISSMNSVGVSIYQEQLFKISGANFLNQQFWLYFYGVLISGLGHLAFVFNEGYGDYFQEVMSASKIVLFFLILSLFFTSIGGIVVASVLKELDNVVKEYCYTISNMFMAIICAFMFPDKFIITGFIFFSIFFLIVGIYCYEKKTINVPSNLFLSEPTEKLQKISIEQPTNDL